MSEIVVYSVYADVEEDSGWVSRNVHMRSFNTWKYAKEYADKLKGKFWLKNVTIEEEPVRPEGVIHNAEI